jgi:hypothetical protein
MFRADAQPRADSPSRQLYPRSQRMGKKCLIFLAPCFTRSGRGLNWRGQITYDHGGGGKPGQEGTPEPGSGIV